MYTARLIVLEILAFCLCVFGVEKKIDIAEVYQNPLSNGFGEDIKWVKWDDAVETALEEDKPIFLLMHKTWCHACRSLKKSMQQSNARKAFARLSQYFVMVNTADDDEPFEEEYRPDGKYIPRLLFLDKNGDALLQFKNKKAEYKNYAYYYASPADILNSMKDVLNYFDIDVPDMKKGDKLKPKKPPAAAKAAPKDAPDGPEEKTPKKPDAGKAEAMPENEKAPKPTSDEIKKDASKKDAPKKDAQKDEKKVEKKAGKQAEAKKEEKKEKAKDKKTEL